MPVQFNDGTLLTTARMHRLLRPLHSKCSSLASLSGSSVYVSVTYASRSSASEQAIPPLAILKPPKVLEARALLDKAAGASLEVSRRVYAVIECFRNIVQVAFGTRAGTEDVGEQWLSLSAMCAIVVGKNMHIQNDQGLRRRLDDDAEDEELAELNALYDYVPPHYRRWTLVTHALSIILRSCPHSATLLTALLSVTMQHIPDLVHESALILDALLALALTPAPTAPVAHPSHISWLADLRTSWTSRRHPCHTDRAFARALAMALIATESVEALSCKSIFRIASELRKRDLPAFVHLLTGACELYAVFAQRNSKSLDRQSLVDTTSPLRCGLCVWMNQLLDDIFSRMNVPSTDHTVVVDFLVSARKLGLHRPRMSSVGTVPVGSDIDSFINASLVCLTTYVLTSHPDVITVKEEHQLTSLLKQNKLRAGTYNELIARIFRLTGSDVMPTLQEHAEMLKERCLLHLEASLWGAALMRLDMSLDAEPTSMTKREKEEWRLLLMDMVDDAERRCYGDGYEGKTVGKWEWEEMVGSWIRKSPVLSHSAKRAKVTAEHGTRTKPTRGPLRAVTEPWENSRRWSSSTAHSRPQFRPEHHIEDKENYGPSSFTHMPPAERTKPSRNFRSIISDALQNRFKLHPERRRSEAGESNVQKHLMDEIDLHSVTGRASLPSDDALDMFACE